MDKPNRMFNKLIKISIIKWLRKLNNKHKNNLQVVFMSKLKHKFSKMIK